MFGVKRPSGRPNDGTWEKCIHWDELWHSQSVSNDDRGDCKDDRAAPPAGKIKKGVGGVIEGLDGRRWGRVARQEGTVWVLHDGRIAKQATQVRCFCLRIAQCRPDCIALPTQPPRSDHSPGGAVADGRTVRSTRSGAGRRRGLIRPTAGRTPSPSSTPNTSTQRSGTAQGYWRNMAATFIEVVTARLVATTTPAFAPAGRIPGVVAWMATPLGCFSIWTPAR